jgi:lipopolysaccharide/colanic/teichoic acid biosynthesis glycosyltransferase
MGSDFRGGRDSDATIFRTPNGDAARQASWGEDLARSLFDRTFALCALLFFAPFLVLIALVILVTEGGPVFFAHKRVGLHGRAFYCLKFRTMAKDAEARLESLLENDPQARAQWEASQKLDDDPRITCVGEFLRKSSLDELPQFLNVLMGDMAIVGPRPIVDAEAHHYGEFYADYLSVKPGVTGLWQVNGRSSTTYEERVAMDVDYVSNRPFLRDLGIIVKTVKVVALGKGAQ